MTIRKVLSVVVALGVGAVLAVPGQAHADGKATFGAKKCGDCHSTAAAKPGEKGPNLSYAGSKYNAAWLEAWLAKPTPIRGVKWGTLDKGDNKHDALSAGDAKEVAAYLMTLTDANVKKGTVPAGDPKGAAKVQGKLLFEKKQGCYGCHQVKSTGGKVTGGFSGATLANAGERLQSDWIYAYIKNPEKYDPNGRMPSYGKKFNDVEIKTVSQYVGSFK